MSAPERLSILYVAYPLLTVSDESAGGAEQMLLAVEREMTLRGHRTVVAAANRSLVCGELLATGEPAAEADKYERREREHNARIVEYLREHHGEFDLIHDQSGSFFRLAAEVPLPVLATLHLPRSFYKREFFEGLPSNLFFNCVSESQARTFNDLPNFVGTVQNGIGVERFPFSSQKGEYLLWLGRICEEKAPHLAIAVARKAGLRLVLAGQVYPFRYHLEYFEREIRPQLDGANVQFVDTPLSDRKLALLRRARALLLTSTAEETSSLVAMEAMACGTPVLAFRRGAFPEIIADGKTGFLVDSVDQMAQASINMTRIQPETCRARVEQKFHAARMAGDYENLYRRVLVAGRQSALQNIRLERQA